MTNKLKESKFLLLTSVFLTWGLIGYNLIEYTANQNFNLNLQILQLDLTTTTNSSLWYFNQLITVITLSFSTAFLILLYGIFNGLSIISIEREISNKGLLKVENMLFDAIVINIVISILSLIFYAVIILPSTIVETMTRSFSSHYLIIRFCTRLFFVFLFVWFTLRVKARRNFLSSIWDKTPKSSTLFALAVLLILYFIFSMQIFNIQISVGENKYSKLNKNDIDINFALGGAASKITDVELYIVSFRNDSTVIKEYINTAGVKYYAFLKTTNLPPDKYTLFLKYRHLNFSSDLPYINKYVIKKCSFYITD